MKILPLLFVLACVAWQACAQEEEPRPVLGRLLKRGPNPRGKPTTTTTPAPQDEAEYVDDAEYAEEGAVEPSSEAPPSSTEGKKLVGGGVRPFRSNADLLESLKKRRQQAADAKLGAGSKSEPSAASEGSLEPKSNNNNKKRGGSAAPPVREASNEEAPAAAPAPVKPSRGRFGRPATRSVQPEAEESAPPAPPAPIRSGRAFRKN